MADQRQHLREDVLFGVGPTPVDATSPSFDPLAGRERPVPSPVPRGPAPEAPRTDRPADRPADRPRPTPGGPATAPLPRVRTAPVTHGPAGAQAPTGRATRPPTSAQATKATTATNPLPALREGAWPSAARPQGLHPWRSKKGRARTLAKARSLGGLAPFIGWLLLPLAILVLALVAWGSGDDPSTPGSTTATTGATRGDEAPTPTRGASAPAPAGARPAAPVPATTGVVTSAPPAAGRVHVDIRLVDETGRTSSAGVAAVLGTTALVTSSEPVGLPLHLSGDAAPDTTVTLLVPQPPAGSRLRCTVTLSGAATGTTTRVATGGMLDCSGRVADLAR